MMKILRTLLNDNDVIMIMLMVMLKLKIIVISLANIELPHLENVKLRLNYKNPIDSQPKEPWFTLYYARVRQIWF